MGNGGGTVALLPLQGGGGLPISSLDPGCRMGGAGQGVADMGPDMTKFVFPTHPLMLGFEPLERLVERTARAGAEGYPPFNIELVEGHRYVITLAVAGFAQDDVAITVEDRQLVIRGQQADPEADRVFLHRGIATRQFRRIFALAEGVEVTGARMENGLLTVSLERCEPEPVVRTIPIDRV